MNRQAPLLPPDRSRSRLSRSGRCARLCGVAALLLAGCRTPPPAPVNLSAPGWTLRHGQAVWRSGPDAPEIAGELLLATHPDGRAFLQFTKTPLPFVVVQTTGNTWTIEFVADNRTYSGHGAAPARLGWLQLARCFSGATPRKPWRWENRIDHGWRLENHRSGEMMEGYLAP